MKKRRMRLAALLMAAMMLCGLAVAEPVHEHQWSAWQKSADHPSQETRTCLECSAVETREHEWGAWIDQGDGTEKHICKNCQKEEIRKIETPLEPLGDDVGDEGGGAGLLKGDGTGTDPNAGTGTGTDPNAGAGTDPNAGAGTGTDTNAGAGTDPNAGAGAGTDPNAGAGTDPNAGAGTDPNAGTGTDPNAGAGTDPNAGTGTDPNAGTGTDPNAGAGTGTDPNAGTGTDPNAGTGTDPNAGISTDPNAGTGTDPNAGAGTGTDPNAGTATDPNAGTGTDPNAGTGTDPNAGTGTDPNAGTDIENLGEDPDEGPIVKQAQIQINLVVDSGEAKAGDTLTYTATVKNDGTADAQNVKVSFTLPGELQIAETSYGGLQAESTLAQLQQGEEATVWLKAMVLESAVHGTKLTVTASADGMVSNAQETAVLEHPQLTLACIAGSNTATEGETLQYTVTLANTGKGPAADVDVAITLPQGVENATPTAPDGTSYAGGIWTVPALAVGESLSLVLQATVKGGMADGTDLTAQAQVTGVSRRLADDSVATEMLAAPIAASAPVTLSAPTLAIGLAVDKTLAATGSVVNYIVTVSNKGSAAADKVGVTVSLPAANLQLGTVTPGEGTSWDGNTGKWTIPSLAPGTESTLKLEAVVTAVQPGETVTGGASIVEAGGAAMPAPLSASAAFAGENAAVHLSITKTADRLGAQPGEELRYTLVVTNNGKAAISSIQVSDKLPDKLLFAGKELSQGTTYDEATGLWTIPMLEGGAQATLVIKTVVLDATVGVNLVNTAEIISVAGAEPAVHPTATASVLINTLNYGFLTVNKTVTGSGASKQRDFPFQVVFTNTAGAAVHGIGIYVKGNETHTFDTASPLTFELRHDETVWIGVPAGLSYTVTETDTKGYTCTWKNEKGVITANQLIQATFVNERQRNTEIPKTGYADQAPDADGAQEAPSVAADLADAYAQNDDLVGWLKAGEGIDLPVVQSDNTYYLDHGFTGEEDRNGTLFLNMNNQLFPPDDVLLIHGHNMKDGSMFGTLPKFERYDYAKEHPLVTFQTIYDEEPVYYVPVSVFNASMLPDHSRYFDITQIVFPDDEAGEVTDSSTFRQSSAFKAYLEELRAVSLWESPVDVNVDDKLLMLITCSYDLEDGRLMVVCRRLRDGETPEEVAGLFAK